MNQNTLSTVETTSVGVDETWELYASGAYEEVLRLAENTKVPEINDIAVLSELELESFRTFKPANRSAFSVLVAGSLAYSDSKFREASAALGTWILQENSYFTVTMLQRFLKAAENAENYGLLYRISEKFIERKSFQGLLATSLLQSAYQLQKYSEVISIFNKYRAAYQDPEYIQMVGFSLLHLDRFKEAEKFLVHVYENLTGKSYDDRYKSAKKRYAPVIARVPELESIPNRSRDESMNLGMGYLFSERYNEALRVFRSIA